jgi:hypothetical protein
VMAGPGSAVHGIGLDSRSGSGGFHSGGLVIASSGRAGRSRHGAWAEQPALPIRRCPDGALSEVERP